MNRREFVRITAAAALASEAGLHAPTANTGEPVATTKMKRSLSCGAIGVRASQREAIALASRHGFDAVEPYADFLAALDPGQMLELVDELRTKRLAWGVSGLPVDFRQDEDRFREGLQRLPKLAAGLQSAGATRVGTWLSSGHQKLTYRENFRQHTQRLREVASVLHDQGQRLGLEYVGTRSARLGRRFGFIQTLAEMRELIAEIGATNVGVVLDSWHWWQAGETTDDLKSLTSSDVVAVDLNDAPKGIALELQVDGRRELPLATGVIDVGAFLNTLNRIGCDAPVRAEPFNKEVNDLDDDAACAATSESLRKAFALIV